MSEKLGQEPALPNAEGNYVVDGLSKRFYAACAAMQGLLANNDYIARKLSTFNNKIEDTDTIISDAYKLADELLKQENE